MKFLVISVCLMQVLLGGCAVLEEGVTSETVETTTSPETAYTSSVSGSNGTTAVTASLTSRAPGIGADMESSAGKEVASVPGGGNEELTVHQAPASPAPSPASTTPPPATPAPSSADRPAYHLFCLALTAALLWSS